MIIENRSRMGKCTGNKVDRKVPEMRLSQILFTVLLISLFGIALISTATAVPIGPAVIYNSTTNSTPRPAAAITTAGGTFTTLTLNTTGQTYRWKAYIGNVSGKLVLADATNTSIFDWSVTSVTGEVYATRSSSSIDWTTVSCAGNALINNEDVSMNMSIISPDTINNTFNNTVHKGFYVGGTWVQNNTCRAIATYVNGVAQTPSQSAVFQEVLLTDSSSNLIYTTLMNENTIGYNNQRYDFQMILAENEYQATPTTYYLYVELT